MTEKEAQNIRSAFSNGYEYPFGKGFVEQCDMNEVNRHAEMLDKLLKKAVEEKRAKWIRVRDLIQCSNCGFGMFPQGIFFRNGVCEACRDVNYIPKFCPDCGSKMLDKGAE